MKGPWSLPKRTNGFWTLAAAVRSTTCCHFASVKSVRDNRELTKWWHSCLFNTAAVNVLDLVEAIVDVAQRMWCSEAWREFLPISNETLVLHYVTLLQSVNERRIAVNAGLMEAACQLIRHSIVWTSVYRHDHCRFGFALRGTPLAVGVVGFLSIQPGMWREPSCC